MVWKHSFTDSTLMKVYLDRVFYNNAAKSKGELLLSNKETSTQTGSIQQAPEDPVWFLWLSCIVFLGFPALCFLLALQHGWPAGKSLGTESKSHFETAHVWSRGKGKQHKAQNCVLYHTQHPQFLHLFLKYCAKYWDTNASEVPLQRWPANEWWSTENGFDAMAWFREMSLNT